MDLRQVQQGGKTDMMHTEWETFPSHGAAALRPEAVEATTGVRTMTLPASNGHGNSHARRHHQPGHGTSSSEVVALPVQTSVVIPAHNEASSVGEVVRRVRNMIGPRDEVIVVDDGSTDETAMVAQGAGAKVVRRPYCFGNGSAVKAGIRAATGRQIVLLDADGQHDPHDIPKLLEELDTHDMVVGARSRDSQAGWARYVANSLFNRLATRLSGRQIRDLTSGFRVMRREIADEFLPLLPNTFGYPATITLALIKAGYTLQYVPMRFPSRKTEKSHMKPVRDFVRFLGIILKIITMFAPMRVFGPVSALPAAIGTICLTLHAVTGRGESMLGVLLLCVSVFLFCIGLVSEQIAALRFERQSDHRTIVEPLPAHTMLPQVLHA